MIKQQHYEIHKQDDPKSDIGYWIWDDINWLSTVLDREGNFLRGDFNCKLIDNKLIFPNKIINET